MTSQPNILWIVSEDCPPWFGCYGDRLASTPNLDGLAESGVLFEQAFSPTPVCAPSRFSLLTGVPSESVPPANNMRAHAHVPEDVTTYPMALRSVGYYCTNNDKTDYNCNVDPEAIWNDCSSRGHWRNRPDGAPFLAVFNINDTHESSVFSHDEYAVDPSEAVLPPYLPDTDDVRRDFAQYYTRIRSMDTKVGALLAQLGEDGLDASTIVIHTSDHGGVTPRSKRFCYDEGLHVPLLVRMPPELGLAFPGPGTRVTRPVTTMSIPPTLLELAGAQGHARMLAPSLLDSADDPHAFVVGTRDRMDERIDMIRSIRDERYRYIRNYMPHRPWGLHQTYAWNAAGYRSWEEEARAGRLDEVQAKFWSRKPAVELYDIWSDPHEVVNLAGDPAHAETEARLSQCLRDHLVLTRDAGFVPEQVGAESGQIRDESEMRRIVEWAEAATGGDAGVGQLVSSLASPHLPVRWWAAIGLVAAAATDHHGEIVDALVEAVPGEPDLTVRVSMAEALAARHPGHALAEDCLLQALQPELPFPIRLAALNALGALGPGTVERLRVQIGAAARDENEYVTRAVARLLAVPV